MLENNEQAEKRYQVMGSERREGAFIMHSFSGQGKTDLHLRVGCRRLIDVTFLYQEHFGGFGLINYSRPRVKGERLDMRLL